MAPASTAGEMAVKGSAHLEAFPRCSHWPESQPIGAVGGGALARPHVSLGSCADKLLFITQARHLLLTPSCPHQPPCSCTLPPTQTP